MWTKNVQTTQNLFGSSCTHAWSHISHHATDPQCFKFTSKLNVCPRKLLLNPETMETLGFLTFSELLWRFHVRHREDLEKKQIKCFQWTHRRRRDAPIGHAKQVKSTKTYLPDSNASSSDPKGKHTAENQTQRSKKWVCIKEKRSRLAKLYLLQHIFRQWQSSLPLWGKN